MSEHETVNQHKTVPESVSEYLKARDLTSAGEHGQNVNHELNQVPMAERLRIIHLMMDLNKKDAIGKHGFPEIELAESQNIHGRVRQLTVDFVIPEIDTKPPFSATLPQADTTGQYQPGADQTQLGSTPPRKM